MIPFSALFLLAALTRKASISYTISAAIMLAFLIHKTKAARMLLGTSALCTVIYFVFEMLLLPLTGIEQGPTKEFLALPMQIISYITKQNHASMPQDQLVQIDRLIGVETILNSYDPNLADPIKKAFNGDERLLLRLLMQLFTQYPRDFVKGAVTGTWKYIYAFAPGNAYYRAYIAAFEPGKNIYYVFPGLHRIINAYARLWGKSPVTFVCVCPGFYGSLLLFTAARAVRNKQKELWLLLCPLLVVLAGLFFTPLNGETRYAYPIITLAPAAFLLSFHSSDKGGTQQAPVGRRY